MTRFTVPPRASPKVEDRSKTLLVPIRPPSYKHVEEKYGGQNSDGMALDALAFLDAHVSQCHLSTAEPPTKGEVGVGQ